MTYSASYGRRPRTVSFAVADMIAMVAVILLLTNVLFGIMLWQVGAENNLHKQQIANAQSCIGAYYDARRLERLGGDQFITGPATNHIADIGDALLFDNKGCD
jgi:hypothetical protein